MSLPLYTTEFSNDTDRLLEAVRDEALKPIGVFGLGNKDVLWKLSRMTNEQIVGAIYRADPVKPWPGLVAAHYPTLDGNVLRVSDDEYLLFRTAPTDEYGLFRDLAHTAVLDWGKKIAGNRLSTKQFLVIFWMYVYRMAGSGSFLAQVASFRKEDLAPTQPDTPDTPDTPDQIDKPVEPAIKYIDLDVPVR